MRNVGSKEERRYPFVKRYMTEIRVRIPIFMAFENKIAED